MCIAARFSSNEKKSGLSFFIFSSFFSAIVYYFFYFLFFFAQFFEPGWVDYAAWYSLSCSWEFISFKLGAALHAVYVWVLDNALGYLGSREPLKIKAIIASIALDLKNAKETEKNL